MPQWAGSISLLKKKSDSRGQPLVQRDKASEQGCGIGRHICLTLRCVLVTSCVPQGGGILLWPHTRVEPAVGRQCCREASRAVQRPWSRANEASDFELPQATMSVLPDRVTPGNEESDSVCDVWLPTALTPHPRCSPLLASEQAGKKSRVFHLVASARSSNPESSYLHTGTSSRCPPVTTVKS